MYDPNRPNQPYPPGGYPQGAPPQHGGYGPPPPGAYPGQHGGYSGQQQAYGYGPQHNYASWGARLGAYLIDGIIVTVIVMVVVLVGVFAGGAILAGSASSSPTGEPSGGGAVVGFLIMGIFYLGALIISLLYYILPVAKTGATPGKKMVGIRIVKLDTGQPPSKGAAFGRIAVTFGINLIPFGGLLDGLWPLWDEPHKQALHDKVVNTIVIDA